MCTRKALPGLKELFSRHDPWQMAAQSGADYGQGWLCFRYCGLPVRVRYPQGEACIDGPHLPLNNDEQALLLQYLMAARGLPPRGQWVSSLDLRGGSLHRHSLQREALTPLARHYHDRPEEFLAAALRHGGQKVEQGDAAVMVSVLPRLPLIFILWRGDEEFPPRGNILFDSVSEAYLATAALYVMAIQAVMRIWFPGEARFAPQGLKQ